MADAQRHIIKKQVFDLVLPPVPDPDRLKRRLQTLYREKVLPPLEEQLDQLVGPDVVLRIRKLEIDLGDIPLAELEEAFVKQCIAGISREIRALVQNEAAARAGRDYQMISREQSVMEGFLHFLKTGTLSWQTSPEAARDLEGAVLPAIEREGYHFIPILRHLFRSNDDAIRRLIWQFSSALWFRLLELIIPRLQNEEIKKGAGFFEALIGRLRFNIAEKQVVQGFWVAVFHFITHREVIALTPKELHRQLFEHWGNTLILEAGGFDLVMTVREAVEPAAGRPEASGEGAMEQTLARAIDNVLLRQASAPAAEPPSEETVPEGAEQKPEPVAFSRPPAAPEVETPEITEEAEEIPVIQERGAPTAGEADDQGADAPEPATGEVDTSRSEETLPETEPEAVAAAGELFVFPDWEIEEEAETPADVDGMAEREPFAEEAVDPEAGFTRRESPGEEAKQRIEPSHPGLEEETEDSGTGLTPADELEEKERAPGQEPVGRGVEPAPESAEEDALTPEERGRKAEALSAEAEPVERTEDAAALTEDREAPLDVDAVIPPQEREAPAEKEAEPADQATFEEEGPATPFAPEPEKRETPAGMTEEPPSAEEGEAELEDGEIFDPLKALDTPYRERPVEPAGEAESPAGDESAAPTEEEGAAVVSGKEEPETVDTSLRTGPEEEPSPTDEVSKSPFVATEEDAREPAFLEGEPEKTKSPEVVPSDAGALPREEEPASVAEPEVSAVRGEPEPSEEADGAEPRSERTLQREQEEISEPASAGEELPPDPAKAKPVFEEEAPGLASGEDVSPSSERTIEEGASAPDGAGEGREEDERPADGTPEKGKSDDAPSLPRPDQPGDETPVADAEPQEKPSPPAKPDRLSILREKVREKLASFRTGLSKNKPQKKPAPAVNKELAADGLLVTNAGLVLLAPFLPRFLENLSLVKDGRFRDEAAQQRAVQLTQHLVDFKEQSPEFRLVLNKVLCNWPIEAPLEKEFEPTGREREECRALLSSVIELWGALGSASPEGLQEGFLKRNGRLIYNKGEGGGWKLEIEKKAIDILLKRLPWGLSMTKLPWMEEMLRVEWDA